MFGKLGLVTVEDLIQKTPWELLAVPGFGAMNLMLVRERLSRLGLSLRRSNCK
jgi:DNA-directed RNA polymerase alpha subunit